MATIAPRVPGPRQLLCTPTRKTLLLVIWFCDIRAAALSPTVVIAVMTGYRERDRIACVMWSTPYAFTYYPLAGKTGPICTTMKKTE